MHNTYRGVQCQARVLVHMVSDTSLFSLLLRAKQSRLCFRDCFGALCLAMTIGRSACNDASCSSLSLRAEGVAISDIINNTDEYPCTSKCRPSIRTRPACYMPAWGTSCTLSCHNPSASASMYSLFSSLSSHSCGMDSTPR